MKDTDLENSASLSYTLEENATLKEVFDSVLQMINDIKLKNKKNDKACLIACTFDDNTTGLFCSGVESKKDINILVVALIAKLVKEGLVSLDMLEAIKKAYIEKYLKH